MQRQQADVRAWGLPTAAVDPDLPFAWSIVRHQLEELSRFWLDFDQVDRHLADIDEKTADRDVQRQRRGPALPGFACQNRRPSIRFPAGGRWPGDDNVDSRRGRIEVEIFDVVEHETVRKVGVPFAPGYNLPYQGNGRDRVQWRIIVELSSTVAAKQVHEVHVGGNATPGCSAATLGLSLAEAKSVLAGLQRHLVQTQAEEHCQVRRRCPRCGGQRPLKDQRPRQLRSLFGTVEVRAPRFEPCRCSVSLRTILSPVKEIMPDRTAHQNMERMLAEFGALLPLPPRSHVAGDLLPGPGDLPTIDTIQRVEHCRSAPGWSARPIVTPTPLLPPADAETIALSIDSGHVRAVRSGYRGTDLPRCSLRKPAMMMGEQIVFSRCSSRGRRSADPAAARACCIALAQHRARS